MEVAATTAVAVELAAVMAEVLSEVLSVVLSVMLAVVLALALTLAVALAVALACGTGLRHWPAAPAVKLAVTLTMPWLLPCRGNLSVRLALVLSPIQC